MAEQSVTLEPGESKLISFEAIPSKAKTYQVSVNGLVGSFKAIARKVSVNLKNPPVRGNYWRFILFNEVWGESVSVGTHIPASEPIMLDGLPAGWSFPLYIDIFIYELPESPYNLVYQVQSAYGPDWPYYKDATIPDYGSYYFNVATERFEKV